MSDVCMFSDNVEKQQQQQHSKSIIGDKYKTAAFQ